GLGPQRLRVDLQPYGQVALGVRTGVGGAGAAAARRDGEERGSSQRRCDDPLLHSILPGQVAGRRVPGLCEWDGAGAKRWQKPSHPSTGVKEIVMKQLPG